MTADGHTPPGDAPEGGPDPAFEGLISSIITNPLGPVFSGSGDQHNTSNYFVQAAAVRRRRGPWHLDSGGPEDEQTAAFVPPPGLPEAVDALQRGTTLLLHGDPGIGRFHAALHLLRGCRHSGSGPVRELSPQRDDDGGYHLDAADVTDGDLLLLDLSAADEPMLVPVEREFPGLRATVRDRNAVLVVIAPDADFLRRRLEPLADAFPLKRPNGTQVLTAHLRTYGITEPLPPHLPDLLTELLLRRRMADIAEFALLVRDARAAEEPGMLATWLVRALEAATQRQTQVAEKVRGLETGRERALLLAAAVFVDYSIDVIFLAEQRLLQSVGYPGDDAHDLDRADLVARLKVLADITVDEVDVTVDFDQLRYADAVRMHFWRHFPGLREKFRNWIIECGALLASPACGAEVIIARYSDVCFEVGRPADVVTAVTAWAEQAHRVRLAAIALEYGLTSPRMDWYFRRQCYVWACDDKLPFRLADLVIQACVQVIAMYQPGQAVVRLDHLTHHTDLRIVTAARQALVELSTRDSILRRVLRRLTAPGKERLLAEHDRSLFLEMADPIRLGVAWQGRRPLITDAMVRADLTAGWAAVLAHGRTFEFSATVNRWLEATGGATGDHLVAVLVDACRSVEQLATLLMLGHRWLAHPAIGAGDDRSRRRAVARLEQAIDTARASKRPHERDPEEDDE